MGFKTIIIGCEGNVSLSQNRIKIKTGEDYHTLPICDIDTIVFSHNKTIITIPLIVALMENNVNIVICDSKNDPIGTFNSFNNHSLVFKQLKKQIDWRGVLKKKLWKRIVEDKIKSEIQVLKLFDKDNEAIKRLNNLKNTVYNDDLTNREAIAARIYFNALFGKEFNRDDPCPKNYGLNYGYKIIASYFNKCIVARGYLPQLGIHHVGEANPFNLTYDFIEPFRAIVDAWVSVNIDDKFTSTEKQKLVELFEYRIFVDNKWFRLNNAIENTVDAYIAFLNEESDCLLAFDLSKGIRDD